MKSRAASDTEVLDRLWNWLDAVPVIWLALVISAYSLVAFYPPVATRAEAPGVEAAEQHYFTLLTLLIAAAFLKAMRRRSADCAGEEEKVRTP